MDEEWRYEWLNFENDDDRSLRGWLSPFTPEEMEGLSVLECGCGGGFHTRVFAAHAESVTAVDLNTAELARERLSDLTNIEFVEADLKQLDLGRQFDVVVCIGVIQHTGDPDKVFENLIRHLKPGGKIVIWTYSAEGNALVRFGVEPMRRIFLANRSRRTIHRLAVGITLLLYPFVYSIYLLPLFRFLPFYEYFQMFRTLPFRYNALNVFDKLNAPETEFISRERCSRWLSSDRLDPGSTLIRRHLGVSYTLIAMTRREASQGK